MGGTKQNRILMAEYRTEWKFDARESANIKCAYHSERQRKNIIKAGGIFLV
jgi:hypothetical protein